MYACIYICIFIRMPIDLELRQWAMLHVQWCEPVSNMSYVRHVIFVGVSTYGYAYIYSSMRLTRTHAVSQWVQTSYVRNVIFVGVSTYEYAYIYSSMRRTRTHAIPLTLHTSYYDMHICECVYIDTYMRRAHTRNTPYYALPATLGRAHITFMSVSTYEYVYTYSYVRRAHTYNTPYVAHVIYVTYHICECVYIWGGYDW